jgi:histidinol-phosphate aminotransferase
VIRTRTSLTGTLTALGFEVLPSQTNFVLVRPPKLAAQTWLQQLRDRKILVRWFDTPELRPYLRITIGTDREASALVKAARQILEP